jgi:inorganic pyrophosphatase
MNLPYPMGHLFEVYKELERMPTEVLGWERVTVAREQILYAAELYRITFGQLCEAVED